MSFKETYSEMVKNLFKPLPTLGEELHHATTGLAGEVGELMAAVSRDNILEECGDLEFYLEALLQKLPPASLPDQMGFSVAPVGVLLTVLSIVGAQLLDLSKKSWIYGKPVPVQELHEQAASFRALLDQFYGYIGIHRDGVRLLNQTKLMKRYPTGYTNEAAIARADKA